VLNISQPNVMDISRSARGCAQAVFSDAHQLPDRLDFRDGSDIYAEAQRLYDLLGVPTGGFIGYIEEYGCMGMSRENYLACAHSFSETL